MLSKLILLRDFRVWVFIFTFGIVAAALIYLPRSNTLWLALESGFALDARYQLQNVFLPDRHQEVEIMVVGDAMFQNSIFDNQSPVLNKARQITINGYEADDVKDVLNTVWVGESHTTTRICTIVMQISPNFSTRMKALGDRQSYKLISTYSGRKTLQEGLSDLFMIVESWIDSQVSMESVNANPERVVRHIGQTRFADSNNENWDAAFQKLSRISGRVVGVFDTRGTEWGQGSDLVAYTQTLLDELSMSADNFEWVALEDFSSDSLPNCI